MEDLVRKYLAAVERFDVGAMTACVGHAIEVFELPNRINPAGSRRKLEALQAGLSKGRQILQAQSYLIDDVIEQGDHLVLRGRWEGILAVPIGRLNAGETMVAHICMHFQCRDGLIVEQRTYDCYEEF